MKRGVENYQQYPGEIENRLRERRKVLGLSQERLAGMAGITRQAICAIEAGHYSPATPVALRLAQALHCRVEDIFCLKAEGEAIEGELVGSFPVGPSKVRAKVMQIGKRVLIRPLSALGSVMNFVVSADGLVMGRGAGIRRVQVQLLRDWEAVNRQVVVAGCDPAMFLVGAYLRRRLKEEGLIACMMSSGAAITALKRGEVHVAGVHMVDERSGEYNLPYLRHYLKGPEFLVITFAAWEEGLIVAAGNPKRIRGIMDLARRDVRLVNRETGSGARQLLDRKLIADGIPPERVKGYSRMVNSHLDVAWLVKGGLADVGVGVRAAAGVFGLDFTPLQEERYDLVFPKAYLDIHPALRIFLDTIVSRPFRTEIEALGGYDTRETGKVVETKAA